MPENLIGLLVIAALALGNWLLERQRNQSAERERASKQARRDADALSGEAGEKRLASAPGKETDEERQMRRFFEALGLPSDQQPVPPFAPSSGREQRKRREAQRKAAASPAPARRETAPAPSPRHTPPTSRPLQAPQRRSIPPAPPRPEPVSKREAPAPSSPFEPEAKPPFAARRPESRPESRPEPVEAVKSEVVSAAQMKARLAALRRSALSGSDTPAPAQGGDALREKGTSPDRDTLRRRLRDVKAIQEAYILREILGPPKALQE